MKDKRKIILLILSFIIGIGTYNLCVFVLFKNYTTKFWIAYAFTMMAFLVQIIVPVISTLGLEVKKDDFLGLPFFMIDTIYLIIQLTVGIALIVLPTTVKVSLVIEVLLFSCFTLIIIAMAAGKTVIITSDKADGKTTEFMRNLSIKVENIYNCEKDLVKKEILKKLYEAIRYSDPISAVSEVVLLNEQIEVAIDIACRDIYKKSAEILSDEIEAVIDLISKRNNICKMNK